MVPEAVLLPQKSVWLRDCNPNIPAYKPNTFGILLCHLLLIISLQLIFLGWRERFPPPLTPHPKLFTVNAVLARELQLDDISHEDWLKCCAKGELASGMEPFAQVYAGHQFGHFVPQLGDGRALYWDNIEITQDNCGICNSRAQVKHPFTFW